MMKHQLLPDFWILTGHLREHLTKTYNQPRALNESPPRGLSSCFAFSGHIRAFDAKFHDLCERFHCK
jgi:hypothetical protein